MKRNNDTPKFNIHKYANYNIIKIYLNILSTATQIFIAMDCLIMMSEKSSHFRKRQNYSVVRTLFAHPVEVTGSMYFSNCFYLKVYTKLEKIGIIQAVSKLILLVNL